MEKPPKHRGDCDYQCSDRDLWVDCTCMSRFNNRRFLHWQKEARELVVGHLLSAANLDTRSIIGHLAYERITALALQESPELVKKLTENNIRMHESMLRILSNP